MTPTVPVLRIEGLTKRYGDFTALEAVSFDVEPGEIFALLGPNGAGKTTLISIVAGLTRATAGRAEVLGFDVVEDFREARRRIGLVPQEVSFDPFFSPLDALRFQRGFFGLADDPALYEDILRNLDLWEKRDAYTRTLSGGMKRRLLIAKALVHEPRVLFLDEPTAGVDVALRQDLWRYVLRLRESGVTVVLTTHYLEEAEELADRVAIIHEGQLRRLEGKRQLMELYGSGTTRIQIDGPLEALPEALAGRLTDGSLMLGDDDLGTVLWQLHEAGIRVRGVEHHAVSLEDVFLDVIRSGGRSRIRGEGVSASRMDPQRAPLALEPMHVNARGFATLLRREVARFMSVPGQTLASPVITTTLYFLVFGYSLGSRIEDMGGLTYVQFILPGLVMLGVISNSFLNTSSSLFGAKIHGTLIDMLVAPLSAGEVVGAMVLATLVRASIVATLIWTIGAVFIGPQLVHPIAFVGFLVLVSVMMSSLGIVVAIHAEKFEQLSALPTYLITPLTYLGGVFYTLDTLPAPWSRISLANPIVYMVNGLRYGMTGVSDVPIGRAAALATLSAAGLYTYAWWLFRSGSRLRA